MPPIQQPSNINITSDETQDQTQCNNNWVRNLFRRPLTEAQEEILSHGPNFSIVTQEPPIGEYNPKLKKCARI